MYTELAKIVPSLAFFDVGGGLGVDYDGSKTTSEASMNYSLHEYARDVVWAIKEGCSKENVPEPIIMSESGRALAAHHAVLISEVIDIAPSPGEGNNLEPLSSQNEIVANLYSLYQEVTPDNALETLHDALQSKEMILESFIHGNLTLIERAYCERIYQHLIAKICRLSHALTDIPEEIESLNKTRLDTYFCNFSIFQSLPDSWAIGQLFPIMPIHRLDEKPTRRAIIADLSCDSDGKIDHFIGHRGIPQSYLYLHEVPAYPYYVGIFLVGAYQEILGGLHNLFGDTNAVNVDLLSDGTWEIRQIVAGDTNEEVLQYMQYHSSELLDRLHSLIEKALHGGRLTNEESAVLKKKIKNSLESYTYLVV
jgi:arginine decarboxylase